MLDITRKCSTFGGIGFNHNVANSIYNTTTTIEIGLKTESATVHMIVTLQHQ